MKEYRVLREVEPLQPTWAGEIARERLEKRLNELSTEGWVVRSFRVGQVAAGTGFGLRPMTAAYFVLLERERPTAAAPGR